MQRVFILRPEIDFDFIAALFMGSELQLTDVVSCTFPSRPEPKTANWLFDEKRVLDYVYVPDIELRYLLLHRDIFLNKHTFISFMAELTNVNLFINWNELRISFFGDYRQNIRAIHAYKVGIQFEKHSEKLVVNLLETLREAIQANDTITTELIAEVFRDISSKDILEDLRSAYASTQSAVARAHLREAIDRAMNNLDFF